MKWEGRERQLLGFWVLGGGEGGGHSQRRAQRRVSSIRNHAALPESVSGAQSASPCPRMSLPGRTSLDAEACCVSSSNSEALTIRPPVHGLSGKCESFVSRCISSSRGCCVHGPHGISDSRLVRIVNSSRSVIDSAMNVEDSYYSVSVPFGGISFTQFSIWRARGNIDGQF